jgi:hypothetical protein
MEAGSPFEDIVPRCDLMKRRLSLGLDRRRSLTWRPWS